MLLWRDDQSHVSTLFLCFTILNISHANQTHFFSACLEWPGFSLHKHFISLGWELWKLNIMLLFLGDSVATRRATWDKIWKLQGITRGGHILFFHILRISLFLTLETFLVSKQISDNWNYFKNSSVNQVFLTAEQTQGYGFILGRYKGETCLLMLTVCGCSCMLVFCLSEQREWGLSVHQSE